MEDKTKLTQQPLKYKFVPPEGGWGYMIALALIIILVIGMNDVHTFGIVFGTFLDSIGNAAADTSTICSIHVTVLMLTGLPANILLQKLCFRKVAFLGSFAYVVGAALTTFIVTTTQIVLTMGVLKGLGMGLMISATTALFNQYFEKRRDFVMNCTYTVLTAITCFGPSLLKLSMETFGFRGTLALTTAFSFNLFFSVCCLHPVKWHMKKLPISNLEISTVKRQSIENRGTIETEEDSLIKNNDNSNLEPSPNQPIVEISTKSTCWNLCYYVYKTLDIELFKSPLYVNLAVGVSLISVSDILFLPFLPLLLNHAGFSMNEISILMTIHLVVDVIGRALLSILVGFVHIRNRYLQLFCAYAQITLRVAFLLSNSFGWIAFICCLSGSIRCLIQNNMSLVFAETFPHRFITTFTWFMVVSGITSLIVGQLIGYFTILTGNNNAVLYVLILSSSFCAITWTIELIYTSTKKIVK